MASRGKIIRYFFSSAALLLAVLFSSAHADEHGIAMFGKPKYGSEFTHFDYVNPEAPKGGDLNLAAIGSFDSLNPYILKGVAANGVSSIYDSLLVSSDDEPFSKYGLLAKSIKLAEDRSWVEFELRPEAKWHDGKPITADDVVFSFETLTTKGHPVFRSYYREVTAAEKLGEYKVRFTFKDGSNRELPLIIGQMAILPKHYYEAVDFTKTTLEPPLGSGPYKIDSVDPGKSIRYARVDNYWAKNLPVNKGRYNFDFITYDYYRDATVAVEAFKAGEYDFREENISKVWNTAYDMPEIKDGLVIKNEIPHRIPTGMQAFVFNTRLSKFSDARVRKALAYAFDFEWTNKNLFNGAYTRTESYFSNSDFASSGLPEGKELELLKQFRDKLPDEVFTKEYHPPLTDGSGNSRNNLLIARDMLKEADWEISEGSLTNSKTGEKMEIEFLLSSPAFERVIGPMILNLKKLGIKATMRTVDSAQYIKRQESFDFNVVVNVFGQSNAPGNEQIDYWHSSRANIKGSNNLAGVKDPVIDFLTEKLVKASTKEELLAATHALDRVLLHGYYVIPNWHVRVFRVIYWNKFDLPKIFPLYSLGIENWWIDPEKAARISGYPAKK